MCRSERCKRTQPPRLVHGEQRPLQHSVTRPVMQITDYPTVYSALDNSVPHTMLPHFVPCQPFVAPRVPMGACQATLVQPRPYSSPGAPALLPARRASPSGGREARDKGVTYYSVDLGRVQRGGRDNDADRDATVITVIPGRQSHQGRCRGAPVTVGPGDRRRVPGPGPCHSRAGTLGH